MTEIPYSVIVEDDHSASKVGLENPFDPIFQEIRAANKARLSHAALALTLTIPDICCALISPKGKSSGPAYADWFDTNLKGYHRYLPGNDVYQLRCGFLHEARSDRPNLKAQRVVFDTKHGNHLSGVGGVTADGVQYPGAMAVNVGRFSEDMITAAQKWFEANSTNEAVLKNAPMVVRYRHNIIPGVDGIGGIC